MEIFFDNLSALRRCELKRSKRYDRKESSILYIRRMLQRRKNERSVPCVTSLCSPTQV